MQGAYNRMSVRERLRERRTAFHLSRAEVAEKINRAEKYYADIERGSCGMLLETMIVFPMYYVFLLIISSMVKSSRNIWRTVSTARKISHGLPW